MVEQKRFAGVMNLDDNNDVIPSSHHKYALNLRFRGNGVDTRAENLPGARLVSNSLPSGTNQCIGSIYDNVRNRVYYFNYNSNGRNGIYYYDTILGTVTALLVSYTNSSVDILGFSPNFPIASVNILYKPSDEGDVLYWTDRYNRPQFLNVADAIANIYGSNWQASYLTVARMMPLIPAVCSYHNDVTKNSNNLRSKLYQFRYRWIYKDNNKSTWSPWSTMPTPQNADDLATDTNATNNNYISCQVQTGDVNVIKIEIAARQNLALTWATSLSIVTLNKSKLSISNNTIYTYNFYNDGSYEAVDATEDAQLFDYVPKKANTQELLNGNQLIYGGITEGNTYNNTLNVAKTVSSITFSPSGSGLYATRTDSAYDSGNPMDAGRDAVIFTFSGATTSLGSVTLTLKESHISLGTTVSHTATFTYTHVSGDTITDVISYFNTQINASSYFRCLITSNVRNYVPPSSIFVYSIYDASSMNGTDISITNTSVITQASSSCYKQASSYAFGIVYFDEFGVTNGVNTNSAMLVNTLEATNSTLGTAFNSIPNIQFRISSAPPSWAKYFSFVRTENLTVGSFKTIISDTTYKDSNYGYLNITSYNTNTNGFPAYQYTKGDRVRIFGTYGNSIQYNINGLIADYPVLDMVIANPSGAAGAGFWLKLQYDGSFMTNWGTSLYNNYYIEVYTPAKNTDTALQFYYEFGETYNVLTDVNGNLVHQGMSQSQIIGTGAQPAIYDFNRGDIYQRARTLGGTVQDIMDMSVSDKFDSEVNANGRVFVIEEYAKETYNSTLVRYGEVYQQSTNINDINRFYGINFEEYDKSKGDIQRFKLRERKLRIFQNRGTGVVNINATELMNQDGSTNLMGSVQLLGRINYYSGEYGIGNQYCSLVSSGFADYYVDPVKGYHMRLSQDGNTPLSELYKGQYFFPQIATKYLSTSYSMTNGGYAKILGCFDLFEEEYITVFQSGTNSGTTLTPYTVGFNEKKNAYSSFYSYSPEWLVSAQNVIISWNNGGLYVHDSATKNNFYGTQYSSSMTFVFNKDNIIKKSFDYLTLDSNDYWLSTTSGDVNTSLGQISNLVQSDYEIHEGLYHAAFMRDANSLGGLINGDYLKGTWLELKLINSGTSLVYLSGLYLGYILSNRNL